MIINRWIIKLYMMFIGWYGKIKVDEQVYMFWKVCVTISAEIYDFITIEKYGFNLIPMHTTWAFVFHSGKILALDKYDTSCVLKYFKLSMFLFHFNILKCTYLFRDFNYCTVHTTLNNTLDNLTSICFLSSCYGLSM